MANFVFDAGEVIVSGIDSEQREEDLEFLNDYFEDFVMFAESYVPDIVEEFKQVNRYSHRRWLEYGFTAGGVAH